MTSSPQAGNTGSWRDPSHVNIARSMVLMATGALIGLGLAGYGLFTARGTSTLFVPPEDVALVNQQPISRIDYLGQLQTLYGVDLQHANATERRKVLDGMIREELFVQRGKELDVASTDLEVRSALVNAVELEIAADAITSQPSEAQLRSYFEAHRGNYAREGVMTVHDFIFPRTEAGTAAEAARGLKFAGGMPDVSRRLKPRESAVVGDEEFYFAAKIHLGGRLFAIARALPDGGVSAVTEMLDGLHVLYMTKNLLPLPLGFGEARDQVLNDYRHEAIAHLRAGDESFLRKRANILIADDMR